MSKKSSMISCPNSKPPGKRIELPGGSFIHKVQYPLTMTSSTFPATVPATEEPPPPFSTSTTKA